MNSKFVVDIPWLRVFFPWRVPPGQNSYFLALPAELLLQIASEIEEDRRSLLHLCLASRLLYALLEGMLYGVIRLDDDPIKRSPKRAISIRLRLFKTLCAPKYAHIVTELYIKLPPCTLPSAVASDSPLGRVFDPCPNLDDKLGLALMTLDRLEVLKLYCTGCASPEPMRHTYLHFLPTRSLRVFRLQCGCNPYVGHPDNVIELFNQPFMRSVEELEWCLGEYGWRYPPNWATLPKLRKLVYGQEEYMKELLASSPITYLECDAFVMKNVHVKLCQGPKTLTCLRTHPYIHNILTPEYLRSSSLSADWMTLCIKMDISPYLNLRRLGYLCFGLREAPEIALNLTEIRLLPYLECIEVVNLYGHLSPPNNDPWGPELLSSLGFPSLTSVLIVDKHLEETLVWELDGLGWKSRRRR